MTLLVVEIGVPGAVEGARTTPPPCSAPSPTRAR